MDFALPRSDMEALCGPISDAQAEVLTRYGAAVLDVSDKLNLISRRTLGRLGEHFVDSAALLSFTDIDGLNVADLGSGGGLPGVVLGALRSDALVTLVESRRNKVVFLKRVVRELELANVRVVHARIEALPDDARFELVVARALGELERVLPNCLGLVGPGGRLVLFKGPRWTEEAEAAADLANRAGFELARVETVELPGLGRATTFVEFHVKR